ncbi:MAG TPA: hypothetical protein VIN59_07395 [Alphaproteobacteria bacterium]
MDKVLTPRVFTPLEIRDLFHATEHSHAFSIAKRAAQLVGYSDFAEARLPDFLNNDMFVDAFSLLCSSTGGNLNDRVNTPQVDKDKEDDRKARDSMALVLA